MERLLGYILEQPAHHGLAESPALWTGSCFLDLAGARFINGVSLQIAKALPRIRLRDAYACVGLPSVKVEPYGPDKVRAGGAHKLRDAAAAALCVGPELDGKWEPVVRARAAVCRLARQAGISTPEMADALALSLHGVRYLADLDLPDGERMLRCVMHRLALEEVVRRG